MVAGLFTAFRRSFTGVEGFSSSNWGWLAFTTIGGSVLAWRLAGRAPLRLGLIRPLVAGAVAFLLCAMAQALMGVIFLPSHPLRGAGDTVGPLGGALHPLVRSQIVPMIVVPVGYVSELLRAAGRGIGPTARSRGTRVRERHLG